MVLTRDEMERQSKEATAAELAKLHAAISKNPTLLKPRRAECDSSEEDGDKLSDSGTDVDEDETFTIRPAARKGSDLSGMLFAENKKLNAQVAKLSGKVEKCRSSKDEMERKYEQIRIEQSNLNVELDEYKQKLGRSWRMIGLSSAMTFAIVAFEVAVRVYPYLPV